MKYLCVFIAYWLAFMAFENAYAQDPVSYVVHGPERSLVARSIVTGSNCPLINVDGQKKVMTVRAYPSQRFPVLVCDYNLDPNVAELSIDDVKLPVAARDNLEKIVVIGDTGCRIKTGSQLQFCSEIQHWPFATIAHSAAQENPQLLIHVGDYLYRERACDDAETRCVPGSFGDNWLTWKAEFFVPGAELLRKAPWVSVRGDHESCGRAGIGYFLFLDPRPLMKSCQEDSDPYRVELNGLTLINFDSSTGNKEKNQKRFSEKFASIEPSTQESWLITHMPIRAFAPARQARTLSEVTQPLRQAMGSLKAPVTKILSGHIHQFQMLSLEREPTQFVIGMSGTLLDWAVPRERLSGTFDGIKIEDAASISEFGYAVMEKINLQDAWTIKVLDKNRKLLSTCRQNAASTHCNAP